jgi:folate-dependent phosphoribosylglycinamide formyltransferase PurN
MELTKLYKPKDKPMKLAIFMSGSGSNAKKIIERYIQERDAGNPSFNPVLMFTDNKKSNAHHIATEEFKSRGVTLSYMCKPIKDFYALKRQNDIGNLDVREKYDDKQLKLLSKLGIEAVALAGYDYIVTGAICNNFVTVNVHPGDLRVRKEDGRRKYVGLAWVPSAKAILDGQNEVYTSVHLVTPELDGGPLLAVSAPQPVPDEVKSLEDRAVLLGGANSIRTIQKFIRGYHCVSDEDLYKFMPIVKHAKDCQERLKVNGDWIEFPDVITNIALGRYARDKKGNMYFDNKPVPDGVLRLK